MTGLAAAARPGTGSGARLDVDLAAIAHNTRLLTGRATGELMAVVKADGFGHGAADVARTALANGATWLGVTSLEEAFALRATGLDAPLLSWLNPVDADFARAVREGVDVAVPSLAHLAAVTSAGRRARVHLHVDAGMARDGAAPDTWAQLCRSARRAEQRGEVEVVGVMGHLGCADDPADDCNALARTRFAWALETARAAGLRPAHRHLAATSATLTDPRSHHTMSRVGAGLVGIDPSQTTRLRPAMTLTAPVVQVRRVRAGTPVGYGHAYRTPAATHLGLVPLGYADGLPRITAGRAEVLVRGRRRPVVGRISMDQAVVDLGERAVDLGETVTVFGPGDAGEPTVAEWAAWAGTIEHEIVTGIGARVSRTVRRPTHLRSLS
ncbi:alanine racemase [Nocardioides sp. T2.26MG-1]|uniref:alanine racemase n=1 Tax=Nocardioides sp. T2.26MG-1 TaxID=3041166 RepID=UPI002477505B|nr:alanine racemase [Nocardioides sp. T2.26MG-1]CAI9418458.1 Alanine racemase [Nocardioides sp. T2.26MG-1]